MADPPSPERNADPLAARLPARHAGARRPGSSPSPVLLLLIALLLIGGNHGPGRHRSSGRLADLVESVNAAAQDRR
jgi:hypothetical protein